jgi:hypothetical protein
MGLIWRAFLGFFITAIISRLLEGFFRPKVKSGINDNDKKALDMKACPYCGVYTAQPCTNPDCPHP